MTGARIGNCMHRESAGQAGLCLLSGSQFVFLQTTITITPFDAIVKAITEKSALCARSFPLKSAFRVFAA